MLNTLHYVVLCMQITLHCTCLDKQCTCRCTNVLHILSISHFWHFWPSLIISVQVYVNACFIIVHGGTCANTHSVLYMLYFVFLSPLPYSPSLQLLTVRQEAYLHRRHTRLDTQVCPPARERGGGERERGREGGEETADVPPSCPSVCLDSRDGRL